MTSHGEWFDEMVVGSHGHVCTGDDTQHDIRYIGIIPFTMPNGKKKNLHDVLHVPSITKNLLLVLNRI